MKTLIFSMVCLLYVMNLAAQKKDPKKKNYYCAPCGCKFDAKVFDTAGKCPDCNMRLLPVGTFNYQSASVSGNRIIVYASNKSGNTSKLFYRSIYAAKSKLIGEGGSPQISANGKKIVFNKNENEILIYDMGSGASTDISSTIKLPGLQTPAWNPAGSKIIFSAGTFPDVGIYTFDLGAGKVEPLVITAGLRYGAVYSPDGKRIAYRCSKATTGTERQRGIAVYDIATKEEKFITNIGEYCSWSPNGKKLAFHWPDSTGFGIYTVNDDGTNLKKLAGSKDNDCELPSWSPDGTAIYFQTNRRRGNWEIWTMNTDGSGQKPMIWKD